MGAERKQQQPAWWCTGRCRTGWCRTVCSSSAEQHASNRAASGVRGLLHRLRSSLPSADALALQAGAVRHPKFAPMVLLCALAFSQHFVPWASSTLYNQYRLDANVLVACRRFFSMSFVNTILDSLGNSLVVTAVGGGPEVIPFLTGEVAAELYCNRLIKFHLKFTWFALCSVRRLASVLHFPGMCLFPGLCTCFATFNLVPRRPLTAAGLCTCVRSCTALQHSGSPGQNYST